MGCNQSAPVKDETVNTTPAPAPVKEEEAVVVEVEATPVTETSAAPVEAEAEPAATTVEEVTPVLVESQPREPVAAVEEQVEEEKPTEAAPAPIEEDITPAAAPVVVEEEKPVAKKTVKKNKTKVEKQAAPAAPAPAPVNFNDENAIVSSMKKSDIVAPPAQDSNKRVAFTTRGSNVTTKAPKVKNTTKNKKHSNVEDQKMKEMTMAFQRLLTHADHLEAHLSTRNTYTQKA